MKFPPKGRRGRGEQAPAGTPPELIACRFCGHDGEGIEYCLGPLVVGAGQTQVACLMCGTHGPMADTMTEARYLWNLPVDEHIALRAAKMAARLLGAG
jgi:hypothetical protein